jgi:hypothetical protein
MKVIRMKTDLPIRGFDRNFLINELAALGEDKVAALRFAALSSTQGCNKLPFVVREKRVRQFVLQPSVRKTEKLARKGPSAYLGLPLALCSRRVRTKAVHIIIHTRKISVNITEAACLGRAPPCEQRKKCLQPLIKRGERTPILTCIHLGDQEKDQSLVGGESRDLYVLVLLVLEREGRE